MANVLAAATGNWSSTATWVGGVLPGAGDVVMANGFTVTINQDITVTQLRTDTTGGATAGGGFSVVNASGVTRTINASLFAANLVINQAVGGGTVSVVGDLTNTSVFALSTTGSAGGTINITGNWTFSGSAQWFMNTATTINVTGNLTSTGTGATGAIVNNGTGGVINVTGNITNSSSAGPVLYSFSPQTITVTGTVTGGSAAAAPGILSNGGSVTVVGSVIGGTAGAGVSVAGGTASVVRAVGGTNAVGIAQSGAATVNVEEIEFGSTGQSPTSGQIRLIDKTNNKCLFFRQGLSKKTVSDIAGLGVLPAIADVRSGVSYNAGQLTGTCAVPAASLVAAGAAVDATIGTAAITSSSIQSACDAALTAFASGRLADVATTATVGQQIADATF